MIIVHHLENSRSQRVLWLLEELGVPYQIRRYERDKTTNLAPPELKAVHPLGKSPVIEDNGDVVAETGAIVEYLIETYGNGQFKPAQGTSEKRQYTYWMHFAEGSLMTQLILNLFFTRITEGKMPFFARPIVQKVSDKVTKGYIGPNIKAQLDFIETSLSQSDWFAGNEISGADFMMSFGLEGLNSRGRLQAYPHTKAFVEKVQARPAYRKALEKGGAYAFS